MEKISVLLITFCLFRAALSCKSAVQPQAAPPSPVNVANPSPALNLQGTKQGHGAPWKLPEIPSSQGAGSVPQSQSAGASSHGSLLASNAAVWNYLQASRLVLGSPTTGSVSGPIQGQSSQPIITTDDMSEARDRVLQALQQIEQRASQYITLLDNLLDTLSYQETRALLYLLADKANSAEHNAADWHYRMNYIMNRVADWETKRAVNDDNLRTNCPFCTLAGLTRTTASEIAKKLGQCQGPRNCQEIENMMKELGFPDVARRKFKTWREAVLSIDFDVDRGDMQLFGAAYVHSPGQLISGHIVALKAWRTIDETAMGEDNDKLKLRMIDFQNPYDFKVNSNANRIDNNPSFPDGEITLFRWPGDEIVEYIKQTHMGE